MKKLSYLLLIILLSSLVGFLYFKKEYKGDNVNVSVSESSDEYRFEAFFDKTKTDEVKEYMDEYLEQKMFTNSELNAEVTLDNNTRLYVRTDTNGEIELRLKKETNTKESYKRIKRLGEEIKKILVR